MAPAEVSCPVRYRGFCCHIAFLWVYIKEMLNQAFLRCPGGKAPRGYAVVGAVSSDLAEEICLGHGW